jgi:hypothetical protein
MKLQSLLLSLCLASSAATQVEAQVLNRALSLAGTDRVVCGEIAGLSALTEYTVQFSIAPDSWSSAAYIYRQATSDGEFSACLTGTAGEVLFRAGQQTLTATGLNTTGWTQLTLISSATQTVVLADGTTVATLASSMPLPSATAALTLGEGFAGRIDEFRLWSAPLSTAESYELALQTTVSKIHPQWDNLLLYYRFDQEQCDNGIVDYKFAHPGSMSGTINRDVVIDNSFFRYRTVSGYSDFNRHCDRTQINRDTHLMTNDLIILNAQVDGYTGAVSMQAMSNASMTGGVSYAASLSGREGVAKFDGTGAMNLGTYVVEAGSPEGTAYTFEAWVNLSEWREGACLFKKQQSDTQRFNIRLGATEGQLIVEAGSYTATFGAGLLALNQWQHVTVAVNPASGRTPFTLYIDGVSQSKPTVDKGGATSFDIFNIEAEGYIGGGLVGALDEVMLWRMARTSPAGDMNLTASDLKFPGGGYSSIFFDGWWNFDDADNLGYNLRGWQGKLDAIRAEYAGCRGYRIRLGLITSTTYTNGNKVWPDYIGNESWRTQLANDVEKLMPYCDGVDVDFEWLDNNPANAKWTSYGEMVKALRKVIPSDKVFSVSLHPVSYTLPTSADVLGAIDYITFQNYGPRPANLYYSAYSAFYTTALNYGIPAEKIRLSMATTAVRTDGSGTGVIGYRDLDFSTITAASNSTTYNSLSYTFNGVDEVRKKMQLLVDKNAGGCMYFDMGNDISVDDNLSLIRALNSVIAANVDTLVTKVDLPTTGIFTPSQAQQTAYTLCPTATTDLVTLVGSLEGSVRVEVYSAEGRLLLTDTLGDAHRTLSLGRLTKGLYLVRLAGEAGVATQRVRLE